MPFFFTLFSISVKYFSVQAAFLMAYDRCTHSITGDVDCGTDHIQNTVIITKRVYDLLCNGIGVFYDTAAGIASDRCGPV